MGSATRLLADAVVTVDAHDHVYRPGAVDVVDGRIAWVGPAEGAPPVDHPVERVDGLLMPGLVNAHGHTPMTLLRCAGDGLSLDRWLHEVIWPREARMTDEDAYWGMLLGADELLRRGVTTTAEMYLHARSVADAALESGIRCVLAPAVFDLPPLGWKDCLDAAVELHRDLHGRDGRLTVGLGPHSVYALPVEALEATAAVAGDLGASVQIHLAETEAEGRVVLDRHGCSAPELLARVGLLDRPLVAAHAVWLSDADVDLLAEHHVAVAHCPQSNGKLGSGIAPVARLLARGVTVALGTDGPASNDNLDLWEEARLAPLLARALAGDASAMTTNQALRLATCGGAEALGLDVGSLEAGRPADIVRVDLADSCFVPAIAPADLVAHLVWAASAELVRDVWVGGRRVVADGRCTTVDAVAARREVSARARRLAHP